MEVILKVVILYGVFVWLLFGWFRVNIEVENMFFILIVRRDRFLFIDYVCFVFEFIVNEFIFKLVIFILFCKENFYNCFFVV